MPLLPRVLRVDGRDCHPAATFAATSTGIAMLGHLSWIAITSDSVSSGTFVPLRAQKRRDKRWNRNDEKTFVLRHNVVAINGRHPAAFELQKL